MDKFITLRTVANGSHQSNLPTNPGGIAHWQAVHLADDDQFYGSDDPFTLDTFLMETIDLSIKNITNVKLTVVGFGTGLSTGGNSTELITHGTRFTGNYSRGTSITNYPLNPYTLLPWTAAEINTLEAGCTCHEQNLFSGFMIDEVRIDITYGLNEAPVLSPIGNKSIKVGQELTFTLSATDLESNILTFSVNNLPLGAIFDYETNVFSWIPNEADLGNHQVTFSVSDGNTVISETITINVYSESSGSILPILAAAGGFFLLIIAAKRDKKNDKRKR
jgi:hypothetical protein